jgi:transposase
MAPRQHQHPAGLEVRMLAAMALLAVPARYGPWTTCHDRFVRWRRDGTWDRLLAHAQTQSDAVGALDWTVSVGATINRAHQHAAGARKRPATAEPPAKRG